MDNSNFVILLLFLLIGSPLFASSNCELAFSGAEGYGACSKGGKGGKILRGYPKIPEALKHITPNTNCISPS